MHLLDIAIVQPSFQSHLSKMRTQTLVHNIRPNNLGFGKANRLFFKWKYFPIPDKIDLNLGHPKKIQCKLCIKAVAILESRSSLRTDDGKEDHNNVQHTTDLAPLANQIRPSSEVSEEVDKKEELRRSRISKANKGNTPWNKGRKHSAETIQRIRERTRLAMQDPKIKMKLVNLGHAQSQETRIKIGIGVQIGWQRRREKLMLQDTCHFDWQNLIAEASRRGHVGEEELQWDSYQVLEKKLEQEWLDSVELRKTTARPKGSKRGPKSPEQRRKISEAISAKWSDPAYRDRVCSALSKYHGTPVGAEKKLRRTPTGDTQARTRSPTKKKMSHLSAAKSSGKQSPRPKPKRSHGPLYKDPFTNSKLEMIKKIRAERVSVESKKSEAIEQARLMIAEAEKAAKALEVAATKSPIARASLMETRLLIAEAIQLIESIDNEHISSNQHGKNPADKRKVNGNHILALKNHEDDGEEEEFDFGKFALQNLLNDEDDKELLDTSFNGYDLHPFDLDSLLTKESRSINQMSQKKQQYNDIKPNGINVHSTEKETLSNSNTLTKKWVRGRLIEVSEN